MDDQDYCENCGGTIRDDDCCCIDPCLCESCTEIYERFHRGLDRIEEWDGEDVADLHDTLEALADDCDELRCLEWLEDEVARVLEPYGRREAQRVLTETPILAVDRNDLALMGRFSVNRGIRCIPLAVITGGALNPNQMALFAEGPGTAFSHEKGVPGKGASHAR